MKNVRLDLEEKVIAVNNDVRGTVTLNDIGSIDYLELKLKSGNGTVLLTQIIEGYRNTKGVVRIPFCIRVPFSALPGSIQNTIGSMVTEVQVVAKPRNAVIQKLCSRLQDSCYITIQNRGLSAKNQNQMHSVDLDSTLTRATCPEKEDTFSSEFTSVNPTLRNRDPGCCFSIFGDIFSKHRHEKKDYCNIQQQGFEKYEKDPLKSHREPTDNKTPTVRWGFKTPFNEYIFPEIKTFECTKIIQNKGETM